MKEFLAGKVGQRPLMNQCSTQHKSVVPRSTNVDQANVARCRGAQQARRQGKCQNSWYMSKPHYSSRQHAQCTPYLVMSWEARERSCKPNANRVLCRQRGATQQITCPTQCGFQRSLTGVGSTCCTQSKSLQGNKEITPGSLLRGKHKRASNTYERSLCTHWPPV